MVAREFNRELRRMTGERIPTQREVSLATQIARQNVAALLAEPISLRELEHRAFCA